MTRRARVLALRRAWAAVGIPALLTADQARTVAAVHGVHLHPVHAHITLAALAVELTRPHPHPSQECTP